MINIPKDEKIILMARRHWFTIYAKISILAALALLPLFAWLILISIQLDLGKIFPKFFLWSSSVYVLFLTGSAFFILTDYFLDFFVLTNERIMQIEQRGFFQRETHEFRLSNIHNISVEITGLIPTWFDFGDIKIYTAAEKEPLVFSSIPNPNQTKNLINHWWEESLN